MKSASSKTITIKNSRGESLQVELVSEGGELLGTVYIEQIAYHVFLASKDEIGRGGNKFIVDRDSAYEPQTPVSGDCVLIAPYSKRK